MTLLNIRRNVDKELFYFVGLTNLPI